VSLSHVRVLVYLMPPPLKHFLIRFIPNLLRQGLLICRVEILVKLSQLPDNLPLEVEERVLLLSFVLYPLLDKVEAIEEGGEYRFLEGQV
jgi:hypothetical protein